MNASRQPWTDALPFFGRHELACRGSGIICIDPHLAEALPALREDWGAPLRPTSVCRSPAHNAAVGGHPRSLHLTANPAYPQAVGTLAADLAWRDWPLVRQLEFARMAWRRGWAVGLHDGFIHVDLRRHVGRTPVVFLYGQWSGRFGAAEIQAP